MHAWIDGYLSPYSGRTIENYAGYLTRWSARCADAGVRLEDATRADIEGWRAQLATDGLGPRAIRSALAPVRGLYRWAAEEGHLDRDPGSLVRLPRPPRTSARPWLHPDDLLHLLDHARAHADPVTSAAIHLHGLCGTRPGETRAIDIPDVYQYGERVVLALRHRKARRRPHHDQPARRRRTRPRGRGATAGCAAARHSREQVCPSAT